MATHQHRARPDEAMADQAQPSARSRRGLNGINLLMAHVRDGMASRLSAFLTGAEHWDLGTFGVAMGAPSVILSGLLVGCSANTSAINGTTSISFRGKK